MNKQTMIRVRNFLPLQVLFLSLFLMWGCEDDVMEPEQTAPKAIQTFLVKQSDNASLFEDIEGDVSQANRRISFSVPFGRSLQGLTPVITTLEGNTLSPTSGTPQDFRNAVNYTVTADDGSSYIYQVIATVESPVGVDLSVAYGGKEVATTNNDEFLVQLPIDSSLSSVKLDFDTKAFRILEGGSPVQFDEGSKSAEFDFSNSPTKTFTVQEYPKGGKTKAYTVRVVKQEASSKDILIFAFRASDNEGLSKDVQGTITGQNIAVELPGGTEIKGLKPFIAHTGDSIKTEPEAKDGPDFSKAVTYVVSDTNKMTKTYTVNVTVKPFTGNSLSVSFFYKAEVKQEDETTKQEDRQGQAVVEADKRLIILPSDAVDKQKVTLELTVSDSATLKEGNTDLALDEGSFKREFDFGSSTTKTFTVTSQEGKAKVYTVELIAQSETTAQLLSFVLLPDDNADNPGFFESENPVIGAIDEADGTITLTVPKWTNLASLTPHIEHSGASIERTPQGNDFRSSAVEDGQTPAADKRVKYTITAEDKSAKKEYTVIIMEQN